MGDGDQAEVGLARVKLGGAAGGRGVVEAIAVAQERGERFVLEVVEQGRGVQERDGGDAQGHSLW